MDLKDYIRDVPDFPKPGILFKDITPLLADPQAFSHAIDSFQGLFKGEDFDSIAVVESRGFLFGTPLADRMKKPIILVRKPGKLPAATHSIEYALEYGSNTMEIHVGWQIHRPAPGKWVGAHGRAPLRLVLICLPLLHSLPVAAAL